MLHIPAAIAVDYRPETAELVMPLVYALVICSAAQPRP